MNGSEKGRVGQILNGSGVDGPGLRQVIFLTGCNLRCPFCHNVDLLENKGKEYTAEELFSVTLRQLPYIQHGGGVTLSGGEPFLQAEFSAEFFRLCKEKNIHTAIETNGYLYDEELAGLTDLVIADIKNQFLNPPVENLKRLREAGAEILLTSVIVKGQNDTEKHMQSLKNLQKEVGAKEVKLLPLKRLCVEKYQALKKPFPYTEKDEPTALDMAKLKKILSLYLS